MQSMVETVEVGFINILNLCLLSSLIIVTSMKFVLFCSVYNVYFICIMFRHNLFTCLSFPLHTNILLST